MTTATTNIVITAKDSTAAAFASINANIGGLASSAAKLGGSLSAVGAGAVLGSFAAFTKKTMDAQDELFKLSQKTGIAVESLAGLEFAAEQSGVELDKVAKATRQFSLLVAESANASGASAKKLAQLGLEYKDLKDLSPEKQLLALADALSKFGREDRAVALTATLGNRMADLIPLLSGGSVELQKLIDQGKKFNPVTEESARNSERFNDQVNVLSKSLTSLGRQIVQGVIPGLTRVTDEMISATEKSGLLAGALAGVKQLFVESFGNPKILGDVGQIRREIFKTKETIDTLEQKKDSVFFDKNALLHEQEKLQQLEIDLSNAIVKTRESFAANDAAAKATKRFAIAADDAGKKSGQASIQVDKLSKSMTDQSRIESEYIKLLTIERRQRDELIRPYQQSAKAAADRLDGMQQEIKALDLSRLKQISLEQAIELTTIARLEEKRAIATDAGAIRAIDQEIDARRRMTQIIQSRDAKIAGDKIRQEELQAYDQFSIQAARNIQTNLAFGIEQGFRSGFRSGVNGLIDGLASAASQIISQVISVKLLNASAAGGLLGNASSGLGMTNALSAGSAGLNLASMFRGGFGSVGLLSSAGRMLPGAAGTFFSGMAGVGSAAASSGIFSAAGGAGTAFIGGPGTALGGTGMGAAASMGASFASIAGPAVALFAIDAIGRMFAGDKKLGGAENIPVLGGFLAGLFGRGPYKFRQQSLEGSVTASGFDGTITDVYRSKGGLLVGNKHRSIINPLSSEMDAFFDEAISGYSESIREFSENLGFSTQFIDTYNKEIQIKSEKKEKLTEEAIANLLDGIGNEFARGVLPIVDTLKRVGEDEFDTLSRLNNEYLSLLNVATAVLGKNLSDARQLIAGVQFSSRTDFIDSAGGIESLRQFTELFSENFLTPEERLAPLSDALVAELSDLGLSADLSKDGYKQLIQSFGEFNGISEETFIGLKNIAGLFIEVRSAEELLAKQRDENNRALAESERQLTDARISARYENNRLIKQQYLDSVNSAFGDLQRAVDAERKTITNRYNADVDGAVSRINSVTDSVNRLRSVSDLLGNGSTSLRTTSSLQARNEIRSAIAAAQAGGILDVNMLQPAVERLRAVNDDDFLNRTDRMRAAAGSASLLDELKMIADERIDVEDQSLSVLLDQKKILEDTYANEMLRLDNILIGAEQQIAALNGISVSVLTVSEAINNLRAGIGNGVPRVTGNPDISDAEIVSETRGKSGMEIYNLAKRHGVSFLQYANATGSSLPELYKWAEERGLATFDTGTSFVPRTGLALIHKGERIVNPQQNQDLIDLLESLVEKVISGNALTAELLRIIKSMRVETNTGVALRGKAA